MPRKRFSPFAVAVGVALLGFAVNANALLLNNAFSGESFLDTGLGGTTAASRPELAGTVLEDVLQDYDYGALNISGSVQNRVVREDVSGTLDFYWRIKVDGRSTGGGVGAFRLDQFGYSNLTDADWRIDGLGIQAPYTARLFNPASHADANGAINFLFTDPAVQPGTDGSRFFFLHTDATQYSKTARYDLLAGPGAGGEHLSSIFSTFAPSTVPEASSMLMLGMGLAALAVATRKRG